MEALRRRLLCSVVTVEMGSALATPHSIRTYSTYHRQLPTDNLMYVRRAFRQTRLSGRATAAAMYRLVCVRH